MVSPLPDVSSSASAFAPARRAELLRQLVGSAAAAANAQLEGYAGRLADMLLACSEQSGDGKEANLSFNAANLLRKNAYPFHFLASGRVLKVLQQAAAALDNPPPGIAAADDGELTLVPYEEIENRVLLGNLSRPFDNQHAEALGALGRRLAALYGREELALADNPFRLEVFVRALDDAWREFNPDTETHPLLLQALRPEIFLDLAPLYKELNQVLVAQGVLPELTRSYRIRKTLSGQDPAGKQPDPALLQQLQQLFTPPAAGAATAAGAPAAMAAGIGAAVAGGMPNRQLFDYLAGLQKTLFERQLAGLGAAGEAADEASPATLFGNIKRQTPPGAMSQVDENTIDLLASVFDVIFRDQHIPSEIKSLIGFLQVPVLKAALIDKDFFFDDAHPARRMIDVLARSSAGWDPERGHHDPLFQKLKRNVERVQRDFDQQMSVFSDVVSDLESFIRADEEAAVDGLAAPIKSALRQEKLGQASKAAKNEVALRIGTGEVVAFVETFLENRWVAVLTIAYSRADERPQAVSSALQTMDDLIWSVKPKITLEQRKELLSKLPGMLAALNKWLNLIEWDDSDRLQFFAELAECHASIVRAPINLTPERQLEIALETAQKAAERRLEKQAAMQPEPEPDEHVERLAQLHSGMWFEFTRDGAQKKVKLAWVSPMRSLFIFTTRDRQESFSISDEDLAQAFREQRAVVVPLTGLVDRALTQALEGMVANDPVHAAAAAG